MHQAIEDHEAAVGEYNAGLAELDAEPGDPTTAGATAFALASSPPPAIAAAPCPCNCTFFGLANTILDRAGRDAKAQLLMGRAISKSRQGDVHDLDAALDDFATSLGKKSNAFHNFHAMKHKFMLNRRDVSSAAAARNGVQLAWERAQICGEVR